jgi:hypothetical protein
LSHKTGLSSPNEKSLSAPVSKPATVTKCIQNLKNTLKTLSTTDLSRRRALAQQFTVTCEDMRRHACVITVVSGQGTRGQLAVLWRRTCQSVVERPCEHPNLKLFCTCNPRSRLNDHGKNPGHV